MFKVTALPVAKPGLSRDELIEYYEHRHVPLITSLGPPPQLRRVRRDGRIRHRH
ncbi:hypothetical protein [Nocardia pseudobrasiliensis]|uniref:hypothetical protein n=1 Tax=Nocardia pseudobrasiliensis TaxID=45979 RepID=UPI000A716D9E|nr:hypothetical protein [Nocardia pseudobrasiliensis]